MATGYEPAKAYHAYTALFYCVGIAGVYLLVRIGMGSRGPGVTALPLPSYLLLKDCRADGTGLRGCRAWLWPACRRTPMWLNEARSSGYPEARGERCDGGERASDGGPIGGGAGDLRPGLAGWHRRRRLLVHQDIMEFLVVAAPPRRSGYSIAVHQTTREPDRRGRDAWRRGVAAWRFHRSE